jgi:predicted TIM-barrel fold metal-dependent hydrolase
MFAPPNPLWFVALILQYYLLFPFLYLAARRMGFDKLLFGSDYIHTEGTYPNTRRHLSKLLSEIPAEEAWAIVAGNATRLFGFDPAKLAKTAAAKQSWRSAVAQVA